jgi:hypothetical protein
MFLSLIRLHTYFLKLHKLKRVFISYTLARIGIARAEDFVSDFRISILNEAEITVGIRN